MAYTTINDPSAHFQTKLYTGNGSTQSITNDGNSNLRPDWIWIKDRGSNFDHKLSDSERGSTYTLESNTDIAEYNDTNAVTSFNTDGFSLGSNANVNDNTANVVAWQWAAGGAAPTQTYKVVVVSDSGNKYRFRNSADSATFAQSAVTLDLQEGGTYTFDVSDSSVSSHPFVIGTSANSNEYSTGVTYKLDGVTKTYSQYTSGFASATSRQLIITVAASAPTLYYWCSVHSGMGGQINTNTTFGSTNFDGSILSVVSANTTAGFSIVSYTGTGSNATIGHGLGAVPNLYFVKRRDSAGNWTSYHSFLGNTKFMRLDANNAAASQSTYWQDTSPTSTVFSIGTAGDVNASSGTHVAYCFTEVKGYSRFGSYDGNGNVDGPFNYTGFRPSWLMIKCSSHASNWFMVDTTREPLNPVGVDSILQADSNASQLTSTDKDIDILSNGFKCKEVTGFHNDAGRTYSYYAFASAPLVAPNNIVGLAR